MKPLEVTIKSKQNQQLKAWRKLKTSKGRQKAQRYLIEGWHLVEEAILSKAAIDKIIVSEANLALFNETFPTLNHPIEVLADFLVADLAETETSQGIFAVLAMATAKESWQPLANKYLLIDQVQDPGNLGTLIRTADAAGFDGIIIGDGTVDMYNDKVIRATQGSLWHLDIQQMALEKAIPLLQTHAVPVLATALYQKAIDYRTLDKTNPKVAIIVGNEGRGVQPTILEQADHLIYIPMYGKAESLNVAIAAAILMFHFV
ncbi:TrmH family RNA methyltransferase [Fundicoccus culcitae]|uniref:RNA methyltransferase n=1 Tax=Fundicoccus culcitae TaxID=2969821 RepID=A0ABY5P714_9LACT|nr:RNA methyltransferase [Fundicoccus culcitae]UUX34390.1 RNA methyltransferase [Fundicoccus culcitae]